jgi:hypothetical protein
LLAILIEEFKHCIHSDIKTYIDKHNVSNLVKASNKGDEYALTHKLIFLKNKRAGRVPNLNYVQNRILLVHAIEPCDILSLFISRTF